MPKQKYEDFRNYDKEAREMIKDLRSDEMYRLLEIVIEQEKRSCSDERRKELEAVRNAIVKTPRLDPDRIRAIVRGYRSSMAADARAKDGNTDKWRKKA